MDDRPGAFTANLERYEQLMEVVRNRLTSRQFDPSVPVPREHIEMVLVAARHAPSGANAQPWHYIVVTDPAVKRQFAPDRKLGPLRHGQLHRPEIDAWVREERHKVMYRDESKID